VRSAARSSYVSVCVIATVVVGMMLLNQTQVLPKKARTGTIQWPPLMICSGLRDLQFVSGSVEG